MPWKFEEGVGKVRHEGNLRSVTIPEEFTLVGDDVRACQDKDGTILIWPATEEGRQALDKFSPFGDWTEDDWKRLEEPEHLEAVREILGGQAKAPKSEAKE